MKNGWRMKEIDEMDMLGFLRLRAWDATREQEKKKPRQRFIDEVWPGVKPCVGAIDAAWPSLTKTGRH